MRKAARRKAASLTELDLDFPAPDEARASPPAPQAHGLADNDVEETMAAIAVLIRRMAG